MWVYVLRRLLYTIPILFGVVLVTFLIFFSTATPETLARQELGEKSKENTIAQWLLDHDYASLNDAGKQKLADIEAGKVTEKAELTRADVDMIGKAALFVRYVSDIFLKWDFGNNREHRRVVDVLAGGIGPSLALTVPAFLISELLGIFFALFAALYRNTRIDRGLVIASVFLMGFSPVAVILFAQKYLSADWNYFPITGYGSGITIVAYLALPILLYLILRLGEGVRFGRIIALDEVGQDYVRTARAKGLSRNTVLFKHVLRNVLIPLITHWSMSIPYLFLGSLLLESFFAIPGLGGITVLAAIDADLNMVRALVFFSAVLYILSTLIADVLYAIADPRVKLG